MSSNQQTLSIAYPLSIDSIGTYQIFFTRCQIINLSGKGRSLQRNIADIIRHCRFSTARQFPAEAAEYKIASTFINDCGRNRKALLILITDLQFAKYRHITICGSERFYLTLRYAIATAGIRAIVIVFSGL